MKLTLSRPLSSHHLIVRNQTGTTEREDKGSGDMTLDHAEATCTEAHATSK